MPHEKLLISIITPVYNAEKFIERCIKSVQQQNYNFYEHLFVDGNSTDGSVALIKKYMAVDTKIRLISENDKGVYDAMNKGISIAHGEWVYFLGADDYMYSNVVLNRIGQTLFTTDSKMIYGNVWNESLSKLYDGPFTVGKLLKKNISHQAIFYSREIFAEIGFFNLDYKLEADYDFNLRCLLYNIKNKYLNETIAFHSKGGLSGQGRDIAFVKDYPDLTIKYLVESKHSFQLKINIMAIILRKILLRYPFKKFWITFFKNNHYWVKIPALAWMAITFPAYYLNSFIFVKK